MYIPANRDSAPVRTRTPQMDRRSLEWRVVLDIERELSAISLQPSARAACRFLLTADGRWLSFH
jgi:hypothetical protein